MNQHLAYLQLRKEALTLRAELERMDLAQHVAALRRPSEMTYKGLKLIGLLRVPAAALLAARLGGGGGGSNGVFTHLARYAGVALATWRIYRGARELFTPARVKADR